MMTSRVVVQQGTSPSGVIASINKPLNRQELHSNGAKNPFRMLVIPVVYHFYEYINVGLRQRVSKEVSIERLHAIPRNRRRGTPSGA
jgi:hypothetical protein